MFQGSLLGKLIRIVDCHSYNLLTHISGGCRQNSDKWSESRSVVSSYPMDSTVHGILQARILEWVAVPFSRGSSQQRARTQVSHIAGLFFTSWATRKPKNIGVDTRFEPGSPALQVDSLPAEPLGKPKNTGVGSLSLLQWIFPTQESNRGLLHCRHIVYLSGKKSLKRFL